MNALMMTGLASVFLQSTPIDAEAAQQDRPLALGDFAPLMEARLRRLIEDGEAHDPKNAFGPDVTRPDTCVDMQMEIIVESDAATPVFGLDEWVIATARDYRERCLHASRLEAH